MYAVQTGVSVYLSPRGAPRFEKLPRMLCFTLGDDPHVLEVELVILLDLGELKLERVDNALLLLISDHG